jgi:hypothetical protein
VVRYSAKVLERAACIEDNSMIINAYLNRGLAYERTEKFRDAINDFMRIK